MITLKKITDLLKWKKDENKFLEKSQKNENGFSKI
jgi:hypothetical protein